LLRIKLIAHLGKISLHEGNLFFQSSGPVIHIQIPAKMFCSHISCAWCNHVNVIKAPIRHQIHMRSSIFEKTAFYIGRDEYGTPTTMVILRVACIL
jgi:hypothetical protein